MSDAAARSAEIARRALDMHARYRGKMQTLPRCPVRGREDFALWYTPGVAAVSRAVAEDRARSLDLTGRGNTVAVVSDGSRVLGLGDIGPEAAMPVMEGKALLFKYLGGVDAVALCIDRHDEDGIVSFVEAIAPSFGAINLEDIATPKCFRVLERLCESLPIPVWHDDQQGTAAAALAGLQNALAVVGKRLSKVRIAMIGMGAANHACYRLLKSAGVDPLQIVACDSRGILHGARADIAAERETLREKWQVCEETGARRRSGGIVDALQGADVCIAFSAPGPDTIPAEAVAGMANDAIVFACANPTPEIWPGDARAAGAAIVATGRSDFPNQVNNALVFPGLFRGLLDVRARRISDAMALAAATALARRATDQGLQPEHLLPGIEDVHAAAAVAGAVAGAARAESLAMAPHDPADERAAAVALIEAAQRASKASFGAAVPAVDHR